MMRALGNRHVAWLALNRQPYAGQFPVITGDATFPINEGDSLLVIRAREATGLSLTEQLWIDVRSRLDVPEATEDDFETICELRSVDGQIVGPAGMFSVPARLLAGRQVVMRALVPAGDVYDVTAVLIGTRKYQSNLPTADLGEGLTQTTFLPAEVHEQVLYEGDVEVADDVIVGTAFGPGFQIPIEAFDHTILVASYTVTTGAPTFGAKLQESDDDDNGDPYADSGVEVAGEVFPASGQASFDNSQLPAIEPWVRAFVTGTGTGTGKLRVSMIWSRTAD